MNYSYQIIEGIEVQPVELKIARAKNLALAIQQHSYCLEGTLVCRQRTDNSEVILLTLDIEIPQNPRNGIQVYEDIAIIFSESDSNFPEVYALREDFLSSLPHTNLSTFEHPVSLCVTEQTYSEVKHKLTEFDFIRYIFRWFSLTSEGKLHQEDQPLEPFFNIGKGVIVSNNYSRLEKGYLHKIADSELFRLDNTLSEKNSLYVFGIEADPQVHGFVRKRPTILGDLAEVVKIKNQTLSSLIKDLFDNELRAGLGNMALYEVNFAIYCLIPVKRDENDNKPSSFYELLICANQNFVQVGKMSSCLDEINGNIVPLIGKSFDIDVINEISIEVLLPIFDFNPDKASLYNNIEINNSEILLIGAGALGSQLFEQFSRMGFGRWTIIDHDNLYPHNLAKHSLGRSAIGCNKAIKVSEKANELHQIEIAKAVPRNFLAIKDEDWLKEKLTNSKVIIDTSTSIAVARTLARDYNDSIKTPRISSFLNPEGTDLVVLAEDKQRKFRLDFLEMQYYRCLFQEESLHDHLKYDDSLKVRYNRNSCREITNRINQTDVALNASICTKAIKSIIETGRPEISIWRTDIITFEVRKYSFQPTRWIRKDIGEWKMYFDLWLLDQMKAFRYSKLPNETGGILIGSYDFQRKIIYVCDSLFAPPDSKENRSTFERGVEGLLDQYNKYLKVVDNQLCYLGEWHSHPKGYSTNPSYDDINLYEYLHSKMSRQGSPAIMGILGDFDYSIIFKP